ncbi:transposable element Tcb2 transposase [Trichonephila clavipes]|nr:transposable element Tcb2 transposase [Trichonephila clavipes]
MIRHARVEPIASLAAAQTQAGPSHRAPVCSRTITMCLPGGHLVSRRPLRVLPMTPTQRRLHLERCCARRYSTETEWNHVVYSYESRMNLSSVDNRVCVWRPRCECLNPAFNTAPTLDVMVWGAIAYDTRSPLILIHGAMTAQRYIHDIFQPDVLPLRARLPGAIFQLDNAWPRTARIPQDCLRQIITLPWPA